MSDEHVISQTWATQCRDPDGRWLETGGGPGERSARDRANELWHGGRRRVRLTRTTRVVVHETGG